MGTQRVKEDFKEKQCPFILILLIADPWEVPWLGASGEESRAVLIIQFPLGHILLGMSSPQVLQPKKKRVVFGKLILTRCIGLAQVRIK